jgi:flagellar protein FlaF
VYAHTLAKTAYSNPGQPTRTPRGTEYEVFARITHRLKAAAALDKTQFPSLVRALHENRELWTMLAVDVASPGNALPPQLRAQIIYLYEFTMQHTSKVIGGTATPEVLIDINTAVMRGLKQGGAA